MKRNNYNSFCCLVLLFFCLELIFISSCENTVNNDVEIKPSKILAQFNNLEEYAVTVYDDSLRNKIIAEIPANGSVTAEVIANRAGSAFYPTYHLDFLNIPNIIIRYNKTGIVYVIEKDKINIVTVPKLDYIETNYAYLIINNNSNSSLSLERNGNKQIPLGANSDIVQSNNTVAYEISPGSIANYSLLRNIITTVDFPEKLSEFKRGLIYVIEYTDTNIKLVEEKSSLKSVRPVSPCNIRLDMVSVDSVRISWDTVYGATSYKIYKATGSIDGSYIQMTTTDMINYTDAGLTAGQTYYYKISAVSGINNEGSKSIAVSAYTCPGNVHVTDKTTMSLTLKWDEVNKANGYYIYRSDSDNGIYNKLNSTAISDLIFTDNNLQPATVYYYRISAIFSDIETIKSNAIEVTTLSPIPENIRTIRRTTTSILIGWNSVKGSNGYNIYRSDTESGIYEKINSNVLNGIEFTDIGLNPDTTYYYIITSINGDFEGKKSNVFSINTLSSIPENINISKRTTISINIEWKPIAGSTSYNIYRADSINGEYEKLNTNTIIEASFNDTGLLADKNYYYKLSSINNGVEGLMSATITANTLSSFPENIYIIGKTTISSNIGWDIVNGANGYNVYRSTSQNGAYAKVNVAAITETNFVDNSLSPNTVYYYKVTTINNGLEGILSDFITIITSTAVPDNIRGITSSTKSIQILWDSVSEASGYNVYRSTSQNGVYAKININTIKNTEYFDTGLTEYSIYYYKVSAIVGNIERSQSDYITANTGIFAIGNNLTEKLTWLRTNAQSDVLYGIVINANENLVPQTLTYNNKNNVRLVLIGSGTMRNITLSSRGNLFTVGAGVTLILDNNVTLVGRSDNNASLINVTEGGSVIMNSGSQITGNHASLRAAGLSVVGGNFIMNGGKIFGNITDDDGGGVHVMTGNFIMNGGEITDNTASSGGGVYVRNNGVFTMTGGSINKNTSLNDSFFYTLGGGGVCNNGIFYMKGGEIASNSAIAAGGGVSISGGFFMGGGIIYGNNAATGLKNTAGWGGAAVFGYVQYGTFTGDSFTRSGIANDLELTIRIVNGNLQTN